MQEIVFENPKKNHLYAKKNNEGQYELVEAPKKGERVYEFAAIRGG